MKYTTIFLLLILLAPMSLGAENGVPTAPEPAEGIMAAPVLDLFSFLQPEFEELYENFDAEESGQLPAYNDKCVYSTQGSGLAPGNRVEWLYQYSPTSLIILLRQDGYYESYTDINLDGFLDIVNPLIDEGIPASEAKQIQDTVDASMSTHDGRVEMQFRFAELVVRTINCVADKRRGRGI